MESALRIEWLLIFQAAAEVWVFQTVLCLNALSFPECWGTQSDLEVRRWRERREVGGVAVGDLVKPSPSPLLKGKDKMGRAASRSTSSHPLKSVLSLGVQSPRTPCPCFYLGDA